MVALQPAFGSDVARPYDLSDDGRYILVSVVPADGSPIRFERLDRQTGLRRTVSSLSEETSPQAYSISADGRYIGLLSVSAGQEPNVVSLGRLDMDTGLLATTLPFPGTVIGGRMMTSRTGRYTVFVELHGTTKKVVRHDWQTGERVDIGTVDMPFRNMYTAISGQGRFVVWDGHLTDVETSTTVLFLDRFPDTATDVFVSDDGEKVLFAHPDPLVHNDTDVNSDVMVWHRSLDIFRRVSMPELGVQRGGARAGYVMSADGSTVVYAGEDPSGRYSRSWWGGPLLVAALDEPLERGVVDAAEVGEGYVLLLANGTVETRSDATSYPSCVAQKDGSPAGVALRSGERATSLSPTPAEDGYWIFTNIGRVFACGAAAHFGDLDEFDLAGEVVDTVATTSGNGYYMVGADGGLFAFGDATFRGSVPEVLPGVTLDAPISAITVTDSGSGYRMVAADGGMFNFGDAAYYGSVPEVLPGVTLASPVVGMVASPSGYLMIGGDGGVFNFGESVFHGSLGDRFNPDPIRSVIVVDDLTGYVMFDGNGQPFPFGTGEQVLE
ncbi:MAG: hypothetical protein R2770_18870 [Acidimicrobiales bacterium]